MMYKSEIYFFLLKEQNSELLFGKNVLMKNLMAFPPPLSFDSTALARVFLLWKVQHFFSQEEMDPQLHPAHHESQGNGANMQV